MSLIADANGQISGVFTIPSGIPAGVKNVEVVGKGGTIGTTTFIGQGTFTTTTLQDVTTLTTRFWNVNVDPLAQTFMPSRNIQLAGVDFWYTASRGAVRVQLRETQNGFPTRTILAEQILQQQNITLNTWTRVLFNLPVYVQSDTEYALVVLCDEAITALAVAELGRFDAGLQQWVTSQPYTVGVLLSSSNASTWTAHQKTDMTFRLLEADYTEHNKAQALGEVAVEDATDMLLLSAALQPTAQTTVEYQLTLPNGEELTVASGQPMRMPTPLTGAVQVKTQLHGTVNASPVLIPGTQLVTGKVGGEATYFTRSISASGARKVVVLFDALIPGGAGVTPALQLDDDIFGSMTLVETTRQDDDVIEFRYEKDVDGVHLAKLRLNLTGTSAARPMVRNIRMMTLI